MHQIALALALPRSRASTPQHIDRDEPEGQRPDEKKRCHCSCSGSARVRCGPSARHRPLCTSAPSPPPLPSLLRSSSAAPRRSMERRTSIDGSIDRQSHDDRSGRSTSHQAICTQREAQSHSLTERRADGSERAIAVQRSRRRRGGRAGGELDRTRSRGGNAAHWPPTPTPKTTLFQIPLPDSDGPRIYWISRHVLKREIRGCQNSTRSPISGFPKPK